MKSTRLVLASVLWCGAALAAAEGQIGALAVEEKPDRLVITDGGKPVCTYVFRDEKILRPYFAHVHAPCGVQVTRTQPPVASVDATDHDTMHPGVWLAFGDVSGRDFWRNKAAIVHVRFLEPLAVRDGQVAFTSENVLQAAGGERICTQISRVTLAARPAGYLLIWEATFASEAHDFVFGDQEEMGLGVRMATGITEKNGGVIRTSTGATGAKATWGRIAEWSDCSGNVGDLRVGVLLMPDPANFRPSWFHNRDYGLTVANPFGCNAFTNGEKSAVAVKKGEPFRLRFGVLIHAAPAGRDVDLAAEYEHFKNLLRGANVPRAGAPAAPRGESAR